MTLRLTAEQARNAGIVPKRKRAKGKVKAEDARRELFKSACRAHGIPEPVCEHPFAAPERHWRWDYCWPDHGKIALEVDGGVWGEACGRDGVAEGIALQIDQAEVGVEDRTPDVRVPAVLREGQAEVGGRRIRHQLPQGFASIRAESLLMASSVALARSFVLFTWFAGSICGRLNATRPLVALLPTAGFEIAVFRTLMIGTNQNPK